MKLNYRRTFLIGLAFLSISAFWQMYDNIIPLMLQGTFGLGETVTGFIMAADNVLALFLLPIFGSLSDRVDTPLGKRMPFIVGGGRLSHDASRCGRKCEYHALYRLAVSSSDLHGAVPLPGRCADAGSDTQQAAEQGKRDH